MAIQIRGLFHIGEWIIYLFLTLVRNISTGCDITSGISSGMLDLIRAIEIHRNINKNSNYLNSSGTHQPINQLSI